MKMRFSTLLVLLSALCFPAYADYGCNDCCNWGEILFGKPGDRRPVNLRTNLLYDAAAVPNLGIEVGFAKRFSIGADWMHAWWSNWEKGHFWRIYGGNVELRYWFKPETWTGHHIGVSGKMITYDFAFGESGVLAPKWQWGTGIAYGYTLPLASRFSIDFSITLGYLWGNYKKYCNNCDQYIWKENRKNRYFGPTKAEISLVLLLNRKNPPKTQNTLDSNP